MKATIKMHVKSNIGKTDFEIDVHNTRILYKYSVKQQNIIYC